MIFKYFPASYRSLSFLCLYKFLGISLLFGVILRTIKCKRGKIFPEILFLFVRITITIWHFYERGNVSELKNILYSIHVCQLMLVKFCKDHFRSFLNVPLTFKHLLLYLHYLKHFYFQATIFRSGKRSFQSIRINIPSSLKMTNLAAYSFAFSILNFQLL